MLQEGMEQLAEIFVKYFAGFQYAVLIFAALFILFCWYQNKEQIGLFAVGGILLCLFCNPFTVSFVCQMTEIGRYIRIFWVFPFTLIIALCAKCILERKEGIKRAALFFLIAAVIVCLGKPVLSKQNFGKPQNLYKLPEDVIEVAEAIEQYKNEDCVSPYVIATIHLSTYLRQYDANIRLVFGRGSTSKDERALFRMMSKYQDKDFSYEDIYELGQQAIARNVDMIVLNKYQVMNEALDSLGFERLDVTENYYIFRIRRDERSGMDG